MAGGRRSLTIGCAMPILREVALPHELVEIKLNCSFELRGGVFQLIPGRPSTLFGIPYDRPVVGFGGKTINTLRLWAAAAARLFRISGIRHR